MIAKVVAEELALEYFGFYGDKKFIVVKVFFLNQLYRSRGLTAHRGWARHLLDRRCLVQVLNSPGRRSRADEGHYEESEMESYFHPEAGPHTGPES